MQPKRRVDGDQTRDILVVTRHFPPTEGGIQEHLYHRCLQDRTRVIVLAASCAGDRGFDQAQPFPIHRWRVPTWLQESRFGSWSKRIVSYLCLLFVAVKLRFRYRYRTIEWGHGYDFPVLLALSHLLPVRCLMYLHGHDLLSALQYSFRRMLFRWTLRRVQRVVCNSGFTRDYLLAHQPEPVATCLVHPCVRPEKFGIAAQEKNWEGLRNQVRRKHGIEDSAIVVLSVGRLIARKGFDQIISLLPRLLADRIDIHYVVCGQGLQMETLQSLARTLGVQERVHFTGFVPDDDLGGYYAACDVFAMLTYLDTQSASIEGYGIVYAEAGFFGKPVLASSSGGTVDAVEHNQNGMLVPPQSPEDALVALRRLCQDEQLRHRLGQQGRILAGRKPRFDLVTGTT